MECAICGNRENNKLYSVRERMLNQGDSFQYLLCADCGTLQRVDLVQNIGKYYMKSYEPFKKSVKKILLPKLIKKGIVSFLTHIKLPEVLAFLYRGLGKSGLSSLYQSHASSDMKLLDVGAGNGAWGHQMAQMGFNRPVCVDKFFPDSLFDDIDFVRGEIFDVDSKFDLITFHHSFEHIENPREVLAKVKDLLANNGLCIIRILVCGCQAWNEYHENWFQIDAPRHIFLYTEKAIRKLCNETGLRVERVCYDSMPAQFYISKEYRDTDKSFAEIRQKTNIIDILRYCIKTFRANRTGQGDQAFFYIRKDNN